MGWRCRLKSPVSKTATQGVYLELPGFFRAACIKARSGGRGGGYCWAARALAQHWKELRPRDLREDEWHGVLDHEIGVLLSERRMEEAEAWLVQRFPECMKFVPIQARIGFTEAFREGWYAQRKASESVA
jgi:hypothetical protein